MLCLIGGGNMGSALLAGLLADGREVTLVDHNAERRDKLEAAAAQQGFTLSERPVRCEGAIIAVKPKDVEFAVNDAVSAKADRVLSVAAGVSLSRLHEWAGSHVPVLRAMPNVGARVQRSATALVGGSTASTDDVDWAEEVLQACGTVVRVTEPQIDAVIGIAGSAPAYVFLFVEALIDAGVTAGLPRAQAQELAYETLAGSAALLQSTGKSPADLRAEVVTPAGTTAAALRVLEQQGVRGAVIDAVLAAAARSRELLPPH